MVDQFHTRLIMALTAQDRKESTRKGYNPCALAIVFNAAVDVVDAKSFSEAFTPTRGMHSVAKKLELGLDVDHGRWVVVLDA